MERVVADWSFEEFWLAYPRRVARKAALHAFEKVRRSGEVDFERLIIGVRVYAAAVRDKDMQYVCHPATWLNQGRWEDEPEAITGQDRTVAGAFDRLIAHAEGREIETGAGIVDGVSYRRH